MLLFALAAHALAPASATWSTLQSSPVHIECTSTGATAYCRSTGVIGVAAAVAAETFRTLDQHVAQMASIVSVTRLHPDVLHVVMDYPFPIEDRDYVAKFTSSEVDGAYVFRWVPVTDAAAPPEDGVVRLDHLDGEWRFTPEGENTRVTYTWQADPGGNLPDVGAVRKKAGAYAIGDMARACGTQLLSP